MFYFTFLLFVAFTYISCPAWADQITINALVDDLLGGVVGSLQAAGDDVVSVPDLDVSFKIFIVKGGIKGSDGTFSNLSTLQRTGDAILDLENTSATITLTLDLGLMKIDYKECNVWLSSESFTNELSVMVNSNSISAQIALDLLPDGSCQTVLNYAKFSEIGDLDINMKNLDQIPYIATRIANWVLQHFQDKIEGPLESLLEKVINEQLQNFNLCSLI